MRSTVAANQTILVVGDGISGITAALKAAECGTLKISPRYVNQN